MKKRIHIIVLSLLLFIQFQLIAFAADSDLKENLVNLDFFFKDGEYGKCIDLADSLLKSNNGLMEAYKYKIASYYKQKKYDLAIGVLEEQLKLNANNELALYNGACLYSLTGNKKMAEECLVKLMELNVSNKRGIKKDSDLDNIKDSIIYKNIEGITVRVGGKVLFFDVPPITINDRTMLPMRSVFEALGAQISWDEKNETVTAVKGNTTVKVTIGKASVLINGVEKPVDTAPILKDSRTLVPVRFVSEALGAQVTWNGIDEIVEVLTKAPEGNADYEDVKKQLDSLIDVSPINGMGAEPYSLTGKEGKMLIIAKDKQALELFDSLTDRQRALYMSGITEKNIDSLSKCDIVYMEFIYDSRAYYTGKYDKKNIAKLVYYENGLVVNTVWQDKDGLNYTDYYSGGESAL